MRTLVLCALMIAAPLTGWAEGIVVGNEFSVCAEGPGKNARGTPAVARGKDGYLVVWREGWHGRGGGARINAARVSSKGEVLDAKGIEIAPHDKGVQVAPRVAYVPSGSGVYLVVWQDLRNGKDHDVLAMRVSEDGKPLDAKPIAVAGGPRSQVLPDAASDGKGFLVVWQGMKGDEANYRGYAAPVGADGTVGTAVETGARPHPRVAWGGSQYLVVSGTSQTNGVLLKADGTPAGKIDRIVERSKGAHYSIGGAPGKGWLVLGHRSPPDPWGWGGPGAMRCGFVDAAGKRVYPAKTKEPSGNWSKLEHWLDVGDRKRVTWPWGESSIAWDGTHCVAVWQRHHICGEKKSSFTNCEIMGARVDGGKPVDTDAVPVAAGSEEERHPALASDGAGGLLCVYERHAKDGNVVIAGRTLRTKD